MDNKIINNIRDYISSLGYQLESISIRNKTQGLSFTDYDDYETFRSKLPKVVKTVDESPLTLRPKPPQGGSGVPKGNNAIDYVKALLTLALLQKLNSDRNED